MDRHDLGRERVAPFVVRPPGDPGPVAEVAARAAAHWLLPRPVHLRTGMNALFLAGDDVVLRVGRVTGPPDSAIDLAEMLTEHGIRVPVPVRDQPFESGGLTVVAHRREWPVGPVRWDQVGELVARLHGIDESAIPAGYPVPWCGSFPWWDFESILGEVEELIDDTARRRIDQVLAAHGDWQSSVGEVVVCHGDVHPGNVLQAEDGPVLLDWDLLCIGPPMWDHAPLLTWTERWGGAVGVYDAYAAGYGRSFRDEPLARSLSVLRLLAATLMRLRAGRTDPVARVEAERRLRWWRGDVDAPPWTAA